MSSTQRDTAPVTFEDAIRLNDGEWQEAKVKGTGLELEREEHNAK
jgi:hypothetical protein